jgi:hypothetical protein
LKYLSFVNTRYYIFTRGYATRENIAFGVHSVKYYFNLTCKTNKYPLCNWYLKPLGLIHAQLHGCQNWFLHFVNYSLRTVFTIKQCVSFYVYTIKTIVHIIYQSIKQWNWSVKKFNTYQCLFLLIRKYGIAQRCIYFDAKNVSVTLYYCLELTLIQYPLIIKQIWSFL